MMFANGCVANLTASRVSTERVRKLRFFQPREYVSVDYGRQDAVVFSVEEGGAPGAPNIGFRKLETQAEEPLRGELRDFLHSVVTRTPPLVDGAAARRALVTALAVVEAIEAHHRRLAL
jgi:predicted dehydrogenase